MGEEVRKQILKDLYGKANLIARLQAEIEELKAEIKKLKKGK